MKSDLNAKLLLLPVIKGKEKEEEEEKLSRRLWTEHKKLWVIAGPAIFIRFSMFGVSTIAQAFLGHIGSSELAAFAIVFTVIVRFANGILLGMSSALETLCGQAYGAKKNHMLGIFLQRSWIILFSCCLFLLPLFIFTTPILRLLGQDESVASMAGTFSLWFIPTVFSYTFSFTFQRYLQAQSKNIIIAYLGSFSVILQIFLSWLTVTKLHMGISGAMGALVLAMWLPIFGQFAYVTCGGCPETWTGFSWSAFDDLWPILKLSLSSGAMMCLELWYSSVLILLTGHMEQAEAEIDALSICLNISGWGIMVSFGFLATVSVRVANALGAGNAKAAKFSILVVTGESFAIGFIFFLIFLIFRGSVAYIFTEDPLVASKVADLSPLLAFFILLNSVQPVLSGVANGAGWQSVVAYVNLACYYLIGIPVGVVLGYLIGYQVKGIWIGMILGTAVQTLVLICITWRTNWEKQVIIAGERMRRWTSMASEGTNGRREVA